MILIFSDIHANKKAAKFVESISRGFSEIICCGDICGYGEDFKYCIDMFKDRGVKAVLGNHDYMVINDKPLNDIVDWVAKPILATRKKIKTPELDYLRSLPLQLETDGGIFVTHTFGLDYYINKAEDCKPLLSYTKMKTIAIGHTHIMAEYKIGDVTIINPGSISNGRSKTKPSYVMLDNGRVIPRIMETWE
jgi:putative phosphoesterase